HVGLEKAKQYYQSNMEAKQFVEEKIQELGIDCDYKQEDAYLFTNNESYITKLENEKNAYDQLGINGELTDHMPLDIPIKSVLVMKEQAEFHPLKYLKALIKK